MPFKKFASAARWLEFRRSLKSTVNEPAGERDDEPARDLVQAADGTEAAPHYSRTLSKTALLSLRLMVVVPKAGTPSEVRVRVRVGGGGERCQRLRGGLGPSA